MASDQTALPRRAEIEQAPASGAPTAILQEYCDAEAALLELCQTATADSAAIDVMSILRHGHEPTRALPAVVVQNAALRYQTLVEQIPAVTFMAALDGGSNELYVSPQIESMLGFSQKEWLEDPILWYTRLHPEDRDRWHTEFAATCAIGQPFRAEYRFLSRDGRVVWVYGEAKVVRDDGGRPLFLHGIAFDITKHKEAEETLRRAHAVLEERVQERTAELTEANQALKVEVAERQRAEVALRESESQTRAIVESVVDGIILIDERGLVEAFNPAAERIFGYAAAEVIGRNVKMLMPSPYRDEHDGYLSRFLITGVPKVIGIGRDVVGLRRDGSTFPMELAVSENCSGDGRRFTGIVRDVTERKRAAEANARFAAIVDSTDDAIIGKDLEGTITSWNKAAERVFGYTASEIIGRPINLLIPPDRQSEMAAILERIRRGESIDHHEAERQTKDGRRINLSLTISPIRDREGQIIGASKIARDITEQKKLQSLFYRAQRMESLGTLAGGIAHDLNNLLTPLLMSVQLLDMPLPPEQRTAILETVRANVERGADLVRQVLTFARGVEGEREPVALKPLIKDLLNFLSSSASKAIKVTAAIPDDLWTILGDASKIHQVLMNLCVNSLDAMPAGGTLTVGAENHSPDPAFVRAHPDAGPGPYVAVSVTDTGTGIPTENLERILDPFFTTKEVGSGTGLGLSTVAGIVKSHGGFLKVYSVVGDGTRFLIYLPATGAAATLRPDEQLPRNLMGSGELILLVDDEPSILQLANGILEAHGYRTIMARNGKEALDLFVKERSEIRVVLTDMMMPKMDGSNTIRAIQQLDPKIRIIASSGLPATGEAAKAVATVFCFLSKPYQARSLLKAVREALDSKPPPP